MFIICEEGISALLHDYETRYWIHGVRIGRNAPSISYMLFADDSYVYCQATEMEALKMKELLQVFETASGQKVNVQKSSIFSVLMLLHLIACIFSRVLQMNEADGGSMYLGLPNLLGRNKSAALGFLKDKVRSRVQTWDGKWLSQAGKEVLVKTVIQALPTYAINVFLIPTDVIRDLERSITNFWWGSKLNGSKRIHWLHWERLSRHKSNGGMSFRDFNLAMLGKQCWRMLTKPHSLVSKLFKAHYFPKTSILESNIGNGLSFVWRSIHEAIDLISKGARWKVGTGEGINIIGQPWLMDDQNPCITSFSETLQQNYVSSLMCVGRREWDEDVLTDLFNERDQRCIRNTIIGAAEDQLYWGEEN